MPIYPYASVYQMTAMASYMNKSNIVYIMFKNGVEYLDKILSPLHIMNEIITAIWNVYTDCSEMQLYQGTTYCASSDLLPKMYMCKKINTVSATIKERNNSKHVDIVIRV